jgi:hypothetical protein
MCVGNACGGMSVTTIYPVSHAYPDFLIMGIGVAIFLILISIYSLKGYYQCQSGSLCRGI